MKISVALKNAKDEFIIHALPELTAKEINEGLIKYFGSGRSETEIRQTREAHKQEQLGQQLELELGSSRAKSPWKEEDEALLLKLAQRFNMSADVDGFVAQVQKAFPMRTISAVKLRLWEMQVRRSEQFQTKRMTTLALETVLVLKRAELLLRRYEDEQVAA